MLVICNSYGIDDIQGLRLDLFAKVWYNYKYIQKHGGDKMLFHTFNSQEERRAFGGSMFIELQFCKLPVGTKNKKIISVDSIVNWQNDSLYVSNENMFYKETKI